MAQESPLIIALPPETDYISYLTIVEQYLTEATLPVLHKVLQDETLTTNIGWDLVQMLTPMLPASTDCLNDIARLGNPREVILKVTEALRFIEFHDTVQPDHEKSGAKPEEDKLTTTTESPTLPPYVVQFDILLSMLTVLHARIRTKYPSRFLSTTLQAVLASFSSADNHREDMVLSIVHMLKQMGGIQRPRLPSRSSSSLLSRSVSASETTMPAAKDPEATTGTHGGSEESAIQQKLFQAFLTHIFEEYLLNLPAHDGVPGLAWSTRLMETLHPERMIPHHKIMSAQFQEDEVLHDRNDVVGQLVSLAHDLKITDNALLKALSNKDTTASSMGDDELPSSSADIPLSQAGSALLYTARQVSTVLHGRQQQQPPQFAIFPEHRLFMDSSLSAASAAMGTIGTEPEALLDACLAMGLLALENDNIGAPSNDAQFNEYLQMSSLLASNCPNANLRGHAHYLVSTILRSHPDEKVRYAFISDTLEHCPFENLKTTAVGWIKGEVIEANLVSDTSNGRPESSGFSKAFTLDSLAPYLFPSLQADLVMAPMESAWTTFQVNISFYLAVLNFLYLLLSSKQLRHNLDITDLWKDNDIVGSYIQPLRDAVQRFSASVRAGDGAIELNTEADKQQIYAELNVVAETLERVTEAAKLLNEP